MPLNMIQKKLHQFSGTLVARPGLLKIEHAEMSKLLINSNYMFARIIKIITNTKLIWISLTHYPRPGNEKSKCSLMKIK